jgi:rSAM/selenodomain-associated transferase 1
MNSEDNAILIFSKNPVEGEVKTRLIPEWGTEGALKIYKDILKKTIETVKQSDVSGIYLFCTPDLDNPFLKFCSLQYELKLELQQGNNLGERMANAIQSVLQQFANVVIIGSDCPELTCNDINLAFDKLNKKYDLVLGPSEDGGYYLIGMNGDYPDIFQGINWGSNNVLSMTRERIKLHHLNAYELEAKWDLDRPEDVHRYFRSRGS